MSGDLNFYLYTFIFCLQFQDFLNTFALTNFIKKLTHAKHKTQRP
jgi:hypothetical protein